MRRNADIFSLHACIFYTFRINFHFKFKFKHFPRSSYLFSSDWFSIQVAIYIIFVFKYKNKARIY